MKIEFSLSTWEDWDLGLSYKLAEDENGMHRYFVIGFLFFSIGISDYNIS
jgi:hypothetical protein